MASIRKVTPPERIIVNDLLTPPSSDTKHSVYAARVLQVFKDCYAGIYPDYWTVYPLSSAEYDQVLDQLEHDEQLGNFVAYLRYDFDPVRRVLSSRMAASITHNTFISQLRKVIEKKLDHLADTKIETQPFVRKISELSGIIFLPIDNDQQKHKIRCVPDLMFKHKDAMWPGIVIEVSYSQQKKDLPNLADNYILRSGGGIGIMVGIDLEYRKTKGASISIWRLKTFINDHGESTDKVEQVINNQFFRDAEGHHILSPLADLKLPLNYFAVEEVTKSIPDHSIVIDSHTLYTILSEAEDDDNRMKTMQGINRPPSKRKEYREQTPPEELTYSDEEKIKEKERRVRRKREEEEEGGGGRCFLRSREQPIGISLKPDRLLV